MFQMILILFGRPVLPVAIITVWGIMMLYCLEDFDKRQVLFVFGITFFTFLLGRILLVEIFPLFEEDPVFPEKVDQTVDVILLVSLISLLVGYIFFESFNKCKFIEINQIPFGSNNVDKGHLYSEYSIIAKILFYCTFPFLIITTAGKVLYVIRYGYLQYYTSYELQVPYVVKKIGDFAQINLFIFLLCSPSKNEARPILTWYIIYLFLTLGTGQRFNFVCGLLILIVYFMMRNKENNEVWLSKKEIILMIVIFPVFLSFLSWINALRLNEELTFNGFLRNFFNFFYDLGSSVNVLKYEVSIGSKLKHTYYCFGTIITFFKENLISRLFGAPSYTGNTVEHGLNGYSYTHAISYAGWGSYYLAGNGMGSSYIAELYHAFSYPGLILGNIFYAFLVNKLYKFNGNSVLPRALIFYSLYDFLLAPRGPFDGFTSAIFNPTSIIGILIVYVLAKHLANRKVKLSIS